MSFHHGYSAREWGEAAIRAADYASEIAGTTIVYSCETSIKSAVDSLKSRLDRERQVSNDLAGQLAVAKRNEQYRAQELSEVRNQLEICRQDITNYSDALRTKGRELGEVRLNSEAAMRDFHRAAAYAATLAGVEEDLSAYTTVVKAVDALDALGPLADTFSYMIYSDSPPSTYI